MPKHTNNQSDVSSEIICIKSDAFIQLLDETVSYIKKAHSLAQDNRWINADEAKSILGISSNTSLQKLRDEGKIRFSHPMHKVILYDRESLIKYWT